MNPDLYQYRAPIDLTNRRLRMLARALGPDDGHSGPFYSLAEALCGRTREYPYQPDQRISKRRPEKTIAQGVLSAFAAWSLFDCDLVGYRVEVREAG
jgi:hypothetical protein